MSSKRGNKRHCADCGAYYYDLNRPSPSCPKCGTFYVPRKAGQKQPAAERKTPHKTGKSNSKPNSDLWVCVLEGGSSEAIVVSGPSNLNTSALREPGWYFFKPHKSGETKSLVPFAASSIPLVTLGTFLLWFGWFGFNGFSQLAMGTFDDVNAISKIAVNTHLAGAAGTVTGAAMTRLIGGKTDIVMMHNLSLIHI